MFKLLFADEHNRDLLVSLLNAILQPRQRIATVEVVNPEVSKDGPEDRGLTLDILTVHEDGTRTDVEMQAQNRGATERRALYHWARVYRDGIGRGDKFKELYPCRVVFILAFQLLPGARLHSTFRVKEIHDGTELNDDLEIHLLELPKLAKSEATEPQEQGAREWAMFLAAETDEERRRAAMQNRDIEKANEALGRLSRDPHARMLAQWREDELRLQQVELATAERRSREEGLEQGQRALVRRQLEKKSGPLDESVNARLGAANHATLEQYADRILTAASLSEVLDG